MRVLPCWSKTRGFLRDGRKVRTCWTTLIGEGWKPRPLSYVWRGTSYVADQKCSNRGKLFPLYKPKYSADNRASPLRMPTEPVCPTVKAFFQSLASRSQARSERIPARPDNTMISASDAGVGGTASASERVGRRRPSGARAVPTASKFRLGRGRPPGPIGACPPKNTLTAADTDVVEAGFPGRHAMIRLPCEVGVIGVPLEGAFGSATPGCRSSR
jgi:hypothetical protein